MCHVISHGFKLNTPIPFKFGQSLYMKINPEKEAHVRVQRLIQEQLPDGLPPGFDMAPINEPEKEAAVPPDPASNPDSTHLSVERSPWHRDGS